MSNVIPFKPNVAKEVQKYYSERRIFLQSPARRCLERLAEEPSITKEQTEELRRALLTCVFEDHPVMRLFDD